MRATRPTPGSEIAKDHVPDPVPPALDAFAWAGAGLTAFLILPVIVMASVAALPILLTTGFPQWD